MPEPENKPSQVKPPSLLDTVFSVLASFFGVQSEKNRVRDFSAGKPMVFIAVAIVLTLVLVLSLWGIVQLLLKNAGA
ncbi:DUF2970 domain-containing protein [Nevskia ramosa]|uniref:DUF2970 domain-containing protein n=1 Tax=Nevskia ramosa TaxID=64002 RepID=UPI0003B6F24A|nr:DUF2970 domain-containing protein [Nevskia ramosa]